MRYFIDTHDQASGTFPGGIGSEQFREFFAGFEQACRAEGVTVLRLHVGLAAGRAYCYTAAPDADAVRRAHERVGLPFDEITEVAVVGPDDLFLASPAGSAGSATSAA
jgi:hypothetical protein